MEQRNFKEKDNAQTAIYKHTVQMGENGSMDMKCDGTRAKLNVHRDYTIFYAIIFVFTAMRCGPYSNSA